MPTSCSTYTPPIYGVPQGVYSVRQAQTRALQRVYLEGGSVHVCTLLYTHVYTMVYLRVYSSPLGNRYTRGEFTPRIPILPPQL